MDAHTGLLTVLIFIVALLYSSVGHGGASGYLAVLSLMSLPSHQMRSTALILNLVVAAIAFFNYRRAGHFTWRYNWQCIAVSVPMAFIGGWLPVNTPVYHALLCAVLFFAAWRLWFVPQGDKAQATHLPKLSIVLIASALIGLISGVVGVGGGIFLSPLMILLYWATPQQTGATSAFFILANSIAGLAGQQLGNTFIVGNLWPLLIAGILGSLIGSRFGSHKASGLWLRRLLAIVLSMAAFKMLLGLLLDHRIQT